MKHFIFESLFPKKSEGKGLGIITNQNLPANFIVESSPVLVMNENARPLLDQTLLHDYIFEWQPEGQQLCCVALGYLSLYNHSYNSNCEYFMDYEAQSMCIKTVSPINAGEELCINYNGDYNDLKPVWFEVKN